MYLPHDGGASPTILALTTYGKDLPFSQGYPEAWAETVAAAPEILRESSGQHISFEAPDPERWTRFGYAVVLVDTRGVGRSPGVVDNLSEAEVDDYADAIEWAAAQDWSTGDVGLLGMSYLGAMQWLVAGRRPPHLKAIVPWEAFADQLRDIAFHGGIPSDFFSGWYASQVKSIQNGLGGAGYRNRFNGRLVSGDLELPEETLRSRHTGTDIYRQTMQHPKDITIPVLSVGSWGAVGVHTRGNVEGFTRVASPEKWLVMRRTAGSFSNLYDAEGVDLQRRFLDYYLRGVGDWPTSQPRVRIDVRDVDNGTAHVREDEDWPLPRTQWHEYHLDGASSALGDRSAAAAAATYTAGVGSLRFASEPFGHDTEIVGPIALKLWVSSSTIDADLFAVLHAIDHDGHERFFSGICDPQMPITAGWLRASHRQLNQDLSRPYRPYLSHRTTLPLVPGDRYEVDIELWPSAVLLPTGFRVALTVSGADYDHGQPVPWAKGARNVSGSSLWTHRDVRYRPREVYGGAVTVQTGGDTPSRLTLPGIPGRPRPETPFEAETTSR